MLTAKQAIASLPTKDECDSIKGLTVIGRIYYHKKENRYGIVTKEYPVFPNSDIPPLVFIDKMEIDQMRDLDPLNVNRPDTGDYCYVGTEEILDTGINYGDFLMASFEDTIISEASSSVSDLEQLLFGDDEAPAAPEKKVVLQQNQKWFSDVFGWHPTTINDFPITLWFHENVDEEIPELDPYYIWPREVTEAAAWALEQGMIPRLVGLPGTGKTTWAVNYAALTGRCVNRVNFNKSLFLEDLIGTKDIINGDTVFTYGDTVKYAHKASIQILDEWTRASGNINLAFGQRFLENKEIKIQSTGELIKPHVGMVAIVCDNTVGVNDNSDMFPTADVQDVSTLNRFPVTLKVDYLTKDQVVDHIMRTVPELAKRQAIKLSEFTALCQQAFAKRNITLAYSARQYISTAKMAVAFKDIRRAIEYNFINAMDEDDAETVRGFINTVW